MHLFAELRDAKKKEKVIYSLGHLNLCKMSKIVNLLFAW